MCYLYTDANSDMAEECRKLNCTHGCKQNGGAYECFCRAGYRLENDSDSCSGITNVTRVCNLKLLFSQ